MRYTNAGTMIVFTELLSSKEKGRVSVGCVSLAVFAFAQDAHDSVLDVKRRLKSTIWWFASKFASRWRCGGKVPATSLSMAG